LRCKAARWSERLCSQRHAVEPANPEIGIGAAELSVDRETGKVRVKKYVTAADAGKALHPLQCEGQDEGSAMMFRAQAL